MLGVPGESLSVWRVRKEKNKSKERFGAPGDQFERSEKRTWKEETESPGPEKVALGRKCFGHFRDNDLYANRRAHDSQGRRCVKKSEKCNKVRSKHMPWAARRG